MTQIKRFLSIYLTIGLPFFFVKVVSAFAWTMFVGINRPDLSWLTRQFANIVGFGIAISGAFATILAWPYYVYVFLTQGFAEFWRQMFYLWYS